MLKNGRSKATYGLCANGCSCCNTKQERRRAKHSAKRKEKVALRKEVW